ncbi:Protein SOGA1, partial [Acipenser ruthenus]
QEDSADLKCQLHFAKEESALMCKKLTKMAKENDSMKEDLVKYRSLYGDLDSSLSLEEMADSPHSREAELKVHLKLVEEEANLLSRRIVELEVENRGVRAEMDDMKSQELQGHLVLASASYGECGESMMELKRHLQFVEEEADLLRRSLLELEEQNKLLMNDLNKYKSEHDLDTTMSEDSCSVISEPSQEELVTAKLQIGELSGKVKKLQYENRVLLSNLQRCDLASYQSTRPSMETDAEAGDSAECIPTPIRREGPIGGENDSREDQERSTGIRSNRNPDNYEFFSPRYLRTRDFEAMLTIKDQAELVSKAIDLLISDSNGFTSYPKVCPTIDSIEQTLNESVDKNEAPSDLKLVSALNIRLSALQREMVSFMKKVDNLRESFKEQTEGVSPLPILTESGSFLSAMTSTSQDSTPEVLSKGLVTDHKQSTRPSMESDAEAGDSAECIPTPIRREGPIGGENDSREDQERSTGIRSNRNPDNYEFFSPRYLRTRDFEAMLTIKDQAELVSKAIDLLISDSNGFTSYPKVCPTIDSIEQTLNESVDKNEAPSDLKLVSALNIRLSALQREMVSFMKKVDNLRESFKEQTEGVSPLPILTESGSFLSAMTSTSQDSTPEVLSKGLVTDHKQPDFRDKTEWQLAGQGHGQPGGNLNSPDGDPSKETNRESKTYKQDEQESYPSEIKALQLVLLEAKESIRGLQEQLSQERQTRSKEAESCTQRISQLKEEHQKALLRRDFELQSLSLQTRLEQKSWSQERNLMVQESQQLKQGLLLLTLKLKCFLKQWRLGKKLDNKGPDFLEVSSVKDLYMLIEEEELAPHQLDNKTAAADDKSQSSVTLERVDSIVERNYKQASKLGSALADLKEALWELCTELQDERHGSEELTQQFAKAKSAWEVERTELKCHTMQLECKAGKAGPEKAPTELKAALKREREEHQHLLADSYAALECKAGKAGPEKAPTELKAALKREREEHQHLLADSYAAVMDLTKQLQISEKNWSREKLELLEHFKQEQRHWEQRLQDTPSKTSQTSHEKITEKETSCEPDAMGTNLQRTKSVSSMSEFESLLDSSPFVPADGNNDNNRDQKGQSGVRAIPNNLSNLGELNKKNWEYLTNEKVETSDPFKTWDGPTMANHDTSQKHIQRSYTAPDKTGIRIYYSPPVLRRMEGCVMQGKNEEKMMAEPGYLFTTAKPKDLGDSENPSESTYGRWLCNFSKQHRDLLDSSSVPHTVAATARLPLPFHSLEISGNLSDDMKEMTNCVRQAICSSSLERKCKDTASQTVGVTTTATQTTQFVSIGLQTEGPRTSLHSKSWSPRSSSLMSARSRQISTSLDKVHSKIDRPCYSPKYGSPKLQRKLSTSSSKLDSSKDRSLWNLHHRGQNGSAWARSTTTRDSPVLSGLNDGLSSLFNVVEHSGSTESLWKGIPQESKTKAEVPKYGIVQEFFRNVCGRTQTPGPGGERQQKEAILEDGSKKLDSAVAASSSLGNTHSDNVAKIVNKRLLKQCMKDNLNHGSKDSTTRNISMSSSNALEDAACDCTSQSLTSCFARPSRSTTRHLHPQCKLRSTDPNAAEEKGEAAE